MKLSPQLIAVGSACCLFIATSSAQTVFTWDAGGTNDQIQNTANWDPDGVPGVGDTGNVNSALVEVTYQDAMTTGVNGATINLNGTSTLQRNSTAQSAFSGTLNVNDQSDVEISVWWPRSNATLNWNSSGTFSLAPSGSSGQARFFIDDGTSNSGTVVNMSDGFWDLTGNTGTDSFQVEDGTFNMTGGLMITDRRFKLGTTGGGGTFNYGAGAELRVNTMGLFADAVFNMELGSTVYIYAGLLGGFGGQDGADYFRDELRNGLAGSNIYIDGVQQFIGATDELSASNFTHSQLQLDGTFYDAITAVPEPSHYAMLFGALSLCIVFYRRHRLRG
jgi:hypothetical protein